MSYQNKILLISQQFLFISLAICLVCFGLNSCGTTQSKPMGIVDGSYKGQETADGAVRLFKVELDSNNINAGIRLMAHPTGRQYIAVEQYELYDDISRLSRVFDKREITTLKLLPSSEQGVQSVLLELGYLQKFTFSTRLIDNRWYIVTITE